MAENETPEPEAAAPTSEPDQAESPPAPTPARRSIGRGILKIFGGVLIGLGVLIGVMLMLRPYWDLQGNFVPTFDFGSVEDHYDTLDADRAEQRQVAAAAPTIEVSGQFAEASWPHFRGPERDGKSPVTGLLAAWPAEGPPEVWRHAIGVGYSGFVVGAGRAYTLEQRRANEAVTCYELATGRELWAYEYAAEFIEQMGGDGPRSTPTLDGDHLYALGAEGDFHCLNALTGELVWKTNILDEETGRMANLEWALAGSPLVEGDRVYITNSGLGGDSLLAFDKLTGEKLWAVLPEQQAYTSLIAGEIAGRRTLINVSSAKVNGIDPDSGDLLWTFPWVTTNGINCSQPVLAGDDRIFLSSGYGHGCGLFEVAPGDEGLGGTKLWTNKFMKNKFNATVIADGLVFGLDEGIMVCLDLETGKRRWKGGRFGHGQFVHADGKLIVLTEKGKLALVSAQGGAFEEISNFQALKGKTWNHMALAGGLLLVRNAKQMACFNLLDQGV